MIEPHIVWVWFVVASYWLDDGAWSTLVLRRAMSALANAFGDGKLVPLAMGKRMRF